MRSRSQIEKLAIQHVRDGRERMPIMGMHVRERPNNASPAQARADGGVFRHVNAIIDVEEFVAECLPENRPRSCDQGSTDRKSQDELGAHNSDGIKLVPAGAQTSCRS